jgi:transporter family-2 protein
MSGLAEQWSAPSTGTRVGGWIAALSVGVAASVQSFLTAESSQQFGAEQAAFVMLGVGLVGVGTWSIVSRQARAGATRIVSDLRAKRLPWWAVLSGVGGALFILCQGIAVEPLGVAVFGMAFLAGQVVGATLLDAVGASGARRRPTFVRVAAGGLAVAGAVVGAVGGEFGAPPLWAVALVLVSGGVAAWVGAASARTLRSAGRIAPTAAVNFSGGFIAIGLVVLSTGPGLPPLDAFVDPRLLASSLLGIYSIAAVSVLAARRGVLELALFTALGQLVAGMVIDGFSGNALPWTAALGSALTLSAVVWTAVVSRSAAREVA